MRIAVLLGAFPVISETFILRQITGLLGLGHEVDIYAETRIEGGAIQPEVQKYDLSQRVNFLNLPPEVSPWEMPVRPIFGKTWIPGAAEPIYNLARIFRAFPVLCGAVARAPRLTIESLQRSRHAHEADSLSALYRLARLSSIDRKYDVIHAHFGPVGNSYRFLRRLWKAPLVVSFHGYDISTTPKKSGEHVYDRLFAEAAAITANSDFMKGRLEALGCPPEKIHKVHYGIDLSSFAPASRGSAGEPIRVVSVARLVEKKGLEFSIRAFARIHQKHPQMRYEIIGEGPLRPQLEKLIGDFGLRDEIGLRGAMDQTAVRRILNRADIFILASITAADNDQEGTPVSLLEAQASELPVLSTFHGGIPEIVAHNVTGLLAPERDAGALADHLQFLVEHPEIRERMGKSGRQFIQNNFSEPQAMKELIEVYYRECLCQG